MKKTIMKPSHRIPRICYDIERNKFYELSKYCQCENCQYRNNWKREPNNRLVIKTSDVLKVDDIANYLDNWFCKSGGKMLEVEFRTI